MRRHPDNVRTESIVSEKGGFWSVNACIAKVEETLTSGSRLPHTGTNHA